MTQRAGTKASTATVPGTDRPVTFSGRGDVVIPVGSPLVSDPVRLRLAPGGDLAISIYLPGRTPVTTLAAFAFQQNVIANGDVTGARIVPRSPPSPRTYSSPASRCVPTARPWSPSATRSPTGPTPRTTSTTAGPTCCTRHGCPVVGCLAIGPALRHVGRPGDPIAVDLVGHRYGSAHGGRRRRPCSSAAVERTPGRRHHDVAHSKTRAPLRRASARSSSPTTCVS
jgi:hypothetical protein